MSQVLAIWSERARMAGGLVAIALAALWLGAGAEDASARTITPYQLTGSFNATASSKGIFKNVDGVAYNQATDRVLVTDDQGANSRLIQFDKEGNPVPFSGIETDTISFTGGTGTTSNPFNLLAVDNSGGPTQGRIFTQATSIGLPLYGFNPDGTPLGDPWPICGSPCANWWSGKGLDVDPDGRLWIATGADTQSDNDSQSKFWWVDPDGSISVRSQWAARDGVGVFDKIAIRSDGKVLYTTRPVTTAGGTLGELRIADSDGNVLPDRYLGPGPNASGTQGVTSIAVDRSDDSFFLNMRSNVQYFDSETHLIDTFGSVSQSVGIAVDWDTGTVYLPSRGPGAANQRVEIWKPGPPVTVPDVEIKTPTSNGNSAVMRAVVDPDGGGDTTDCYFMYGLEPLTMTSKVECAQGKVLPDGEAKEVTAPLNALTKGNRYYYRAFAVNAANKPQGSQIGTFPVADPPVINQSGVTNVNTTTTEVAVKIAPEGDPAEYWVEYGTTEDLGETTPKAITSAKTGTADVELELKDLTPGETYYYKVFVANQVGEDESPLRTFRTFEFEPSAETCPNALARQQTGASLLLDCRAYELVSAVDTGGANVTSDLVEGQTPYGGNPRAPGSALYSVEGGAIPGTGNPPNRGGDPYLAVRGDNGWETTYVGIDADVLPGLEPFSSRVIAASDDRKTIVFGGDDLCDPCFADGSTGIPVRRGGELVQGMRGSIPVADPVPAGEVREPLSRDGSRLVFGSTQRLESEGLDDALSIYARDLDAGETEVVSTDQLGNALTGTVAGLGVSADGDRVLVGRESGSDDAGNALYHLFVHFQGQEESVPVVATGPGALPAGLSSDGGTVFFTTEAQLAGDADGSADLYRATVTPGGATVVKLSGADSDACTPTGDWNGSGDCGVLGIAGGGGVSDDGSTAYFISPQQLDGGAGVAGEPNLYVVRGTAAPDFVATLDPDDPLVVGAREAAEVRRTSEFEVSPDGAHAVFTTTASPTGFENRGHTEVYRHSTDGPGLVCASCAPTNAPASGPARLAADGSSLTADGRVFFVSPDALALRDTNNNYDVYEWSPEDGGVVELISSGIEDNPSSLLTVTADGSDVLFFTRAALVPNGPVGPLVRIYSARAEGGFFFVPPSPPCAAADECRGAGTQPAPEKPVRTVAGDPTALSDCSGLAARERASTKRMKTLRKKAAKAKKRAAKRRLRAQARKAQRQAKKQRAATERCRQSGGIG